MTQIDIPPPVEPTPLARRRFTMPRVVSALVLREMATSYGKSPGGYLWAVLEPVAGIALMSVIWAAIFRTPAIGTNFAIFFATGFVPFVAFTSLNTKLMQALNYSRQLLVYPVVSFMDAILARYILNMLTQVLVAYIIFAGVMSIYDTGVAPDYPKVLLSLVMAFALAFGIGCLNCFLVMRFPVYQQIWSIATRPLFIISCVIFLFDTIPEPYRSWLWWNPLVHVVGQMRDGFYPTYDAAYVTPAYVFGIAAVTAVIGLVFLRSYYRDVLER